MKRCEESEIEAFGCSMILPLLNFQMGGGENQSWVLPFDKYQQIEDKQILHRSMYLYGRLPVQVSSYLGAS